MVNSEMRHALVLGASGFLGGAVLRRLGEMPRVRLTVLVHRRAAKEIPANARVLTGSLGSVNWDWCRDDPPDVVFHCARLSGNGKWGRYFAALRGNVANRGLIRMLGALPNRPRLVYASGSLMYGNGGDQPVVENAPLRPVSYAREYIVAEQPFLNTRRQVSPVMMFRPGWILGAGSWFERFYWEPARRSGAVPVYGRGNNLMTIAHREDCAAAMIWVGRYGETGVYHPVSLPAITQREFVGHVAAELGMPVVETSLQRRERAIREAFDASMNLRSMRANFWKGCALQFSDLKTAVRHVLSECRARIPQSANTGSR